MASISFTGQLGGNVPTFATNITDLDIVWTGGGPRLFATTRPGPGAGYSAWDISALAGPAALTGLQGYPTFVAHNSTPQIAVMANAIIAAGLAPSGWASYGLTTQGGFGGALNAPLAFDPTAVAATSIASATYVYLAPEGSSDPIAHALGPGGGLAAIAPPQGGPVPGPSLDSMAVAQTGSGAFLLTASAAGNRIASHAIAPDGSLSQTGSYDAASGVGLSKPTTVAALSMNGVTHAVVASSESSSLTVFRVLAGGALLPVDHVVDSLTTRFAGATAMTTLQVGNRAYVVVGGSDDGFEVMTMLPDGRLIQVLSAADTAGLPLADVSALAAAQVNGRTMLFTASASEAGIGQFDLSLGPQGVTLVGGAGTVSGTAADDVLVASAETTALAGGGGDDILVAAGVAGAAALWGGAGADRFVLSPSQQTIVVADYQAGVDRLDLTSFPLLRNLDQLQITQTATGAELRYLGTTIRVESHDGNPIALSAFAQSQMLGLTRFPPHATTTFVTGTAGNDALQAAAENTTLAGLEGDDSLTGNTANDYIEGGSGADTLAGAAGNDLLDGGAGADRLDGGQGRDTLAGGDGDDWLSGGDGDDFLSGDDGRDTLAGGAGHDLLDGGADDDALSGDAGDDTLTGGVGEDRLVGLDGNDLLNGGDGNDYLAGGAGNDSLWGGAGADRLDSDSGFNLLDGGAGNDLLQGGDSEDTLRGGGDDDLLYGFAGNDSLLGDAGNDTIYGGLGRDTIRGGDGEDLLYGELDDDVVYSGLGDDTILGGKGDDFLYGEPGRDSIQGQLGRDRLWGGFGADTLLGGDDDDFLDGGPEDDALFGDDGNDYADGGDGNDHVAGGPGNDWLNGSAGNDHMNGDPGNDSIFGGFGDDYIAGGDGNDNIYGGPQNDVLFGQGDHDMIWGGMGNDTIHGGPGNDYLIGEAGNDLLRAGLGWDRLYGGPGADQFSFGNPAEMGAGAASDVILDFERGIDRLALAGMGLMFRGTGGFSGTPGDLRFNVAGAGGYLIGDVNGDRVLDFSIWLDNVYSLQPGDFIL